MKFYFLNSKLIDIIVYKLQLASLNSKRNEIFTNIILNVQYIR